MATTINRASQADRDRFIARMHELAAAGNTQKDAAKLLAGEFPQIQVSVKTITNLCNHRSLDVQWPGVSGKGHEEAAPTPRGLTLEEFSDRAREFLASRSALSPLPKRIFATKKEDMGFDTEQEGLALFSDLHYYSRIDRRASNGFAEYNIDIARMRLERWRDGLLRFTQMHQLVIPLHNLTLLALGDDLEGHGEMFGSQALQMSESIVFQIMGFVEDQTRIILDLLSRYEHVRIIKVPGNHGRTTARAKSSYTPDNFETVAWELIAEKVRGQCGGEWRTTENGVRELTGGMVDFHIVYGAIALFDMMGTPDAEGFLCSARHGHGIKGLQSTYTGALNNKFRLNAIVGAVINYYYKAHLHEAQSSESEIQGEVIQNGCFVGPSMLSIEMSNAAANLPSQEFMLFHPRRGKTHHSRIHLASVNEVRQTEVIGRVGRK